MRLLLRRSLSAAASASGRLGCALSTAVSRPPWAMVHNTGELVRSPATRASFQLAEPSCTSHLRVPEHLVNPHPRPYPNGDSHLRVPEHLVDPWWPRPDPNGHTVSLIDGSVHAASGDGLLLLDFMGRRATAPAVGKHGAGWPRQFPGIDMDPDMTRFICNPLNGHLVRLPGDRLPDIDYYKCLGILTQSERPNGPPDKYAVAWLHEVEEGDFVTRRFLSQTGKWGEAVGLPSPLPPAPRMDINHEVVAFAGRLWWVDVSWGAISLDPFSDRPELRFVQLPRSSVLEPMKA